jgi:hypothetical protein
LRRKPNELESICSNEEKVDDSDKNLYFLTDNLWIGQLDWEGQLHQGGFSMMDVSKVRSHVVLLYQFSFGYKICCLLLFFVFCTDAPGIYSRALGCGSVSRRR